MYSNLPWLVDSDPNNSSMRGTTPQGYAPIRMPQVCLLDLLSTSLRVLHADVSTLTRLLISSCMNIFSSSQVPPLSPSQERK